MRESSSLFAFPGILAVHTVGLGFLAGLNGAVDLRLLGVALLLAYPTRALTNPVFYLKLGLVAAALVVLRTLLRRVTSRCSV